MEMVDMMILRNRFFEIEKCKQVFKSVDFLKYLLFACIWPPAVTFILARMAILDALEPYLLGIDVFYSVLGC